MTALQVQPHPNLALGAFALELPGPLGEQPTPDWLRALAHDDADAPLSRSEDVRKAMRDVLRHGGYKPTGRGKPAAEYLVRAASEGPLPEINLVVDLINVVSLHSGLSISVVDLELLQPPLAVRRVGDPLGVSPSGSAARARGPRRGPLKARADPEASYVFNASGQTIQLGGLLCLHDAQGPCANAVKDAQRSKTRPQTTRVLMLVWGSLEVAEQSAAATAWLRELSARVGTVHPVAQEEAPA